MVGVFGRDGVGCVGERLFIEIGLPHLMEGRSRDFVYSQRPRRSN